MKNLEKLLWLIACVGFVVGLYGVYDRLAFGHFNANYGSYVPWGLWVAAYSYLMGLSAGAFLLSTLVYVFGMRRLEPIGKLALLTALVTLGAALLSIVIDLGKPERALSMFIRTNPSSVMGWMIWLYSIYFVLLLVKLWFALRADFVAWSMRPGFAGSLARLLSFGKKDVSESAAASDRRGLKILGALGIVLAIAFSGGGGALFGAVGARPYWNTGFTPILFLAGGLLSGTALLTFIALAFANEKDTVVLLGKIVLGLLAVDVLFEWAEFSVGLYASIPAEAASLRIVLFGPYAWVFWGVHVGLGIILPALMLIFRGKSPLWAGFAGLLIAFTFISVRLNIVIPGLAVPELEGLANAFTGPGLTYDYFPSLTEWLTQVWIVSAGLLAFLIGYRVLPIASGNIPQSGEPARKAAPQAAGAVGE